MRAPPRLRIGRLAAWGWSWCLVIAAGAVATELSLTPGERAWIAAHPEVRVAFDPVWRPFSFLDAQGRMVGIDADFLARIAQETGSRFTSVRSPNWAEAYAAARDGRADLLTSVTRTPEREKDFLFTAPYTHFPTAIITRIDAPFLTTMPDLTGKKFAAARGFATEAWLRQEKISVEFVEVASVEDAFLAVSNGGAFATTSNLANASYIIRSLGLTNLKITGIVFEGAQTCFAVRRDWPELVSILDKALAALPESERQAIYAPWVNVAVPSVVRWDFVWKAGVAVVALAGLVVWWILRRSRRLARDLAERMRLQREIEEARDRLAALNDEKTNLLNMVAHDLRGPLTSFLLGVDTLRWDPDAPPAEAALGTLSAMAEQVARMRKLVDNLLDVQALEQGRRQLAREPVDVAHVAHDVLAAQRESAVRKQIALEWEAPPPDITVLADAGALRQVVENLLSNAVKYSAAGGRVRVALRRVENEMRFTVSDDGPGIAATDQAKLFGKFTRLGARPTGGESSHGLGLFIVRHLVTAMGGRVWCESESGRGARFIVALPVAA